MRLTILMCSSVLLCLSVFTLGGHAEPREANCEKYELDACSREFDPVCGDDGKTYSTECMLCFENKIRHKTVKFMHKGKCVSAPAALQ